MREVNLEQGEFAELSSEILAKGGSFRFLARGASMFPFILDGDVLTVQPVGAAGPDVGEVVFYRAEGGTLVAHRVIRVEILDDQPMLRTRGDAQSGPGELVAMQKVLGRVVAVQRGGKIFHPGRGLRRFAALLWIKGPSFGPLSLRLVSALKQAAVRFLSGLQALKPYRLLLRQLVGKRARCRVATVEDAAELRKFYGRPEQAGPSGAAAWRLKDQPEGRTYTLVARLGGKVVGGATIHQSDVNELLGPDWWLSNMVVRKRYQGAGIGERLVRSALDIAAENGATRMNLLAFEQDPSALALYHKLQFTRASMPALEKQLEEEARQVGPRRLLMSRPVDPTL